MSYRWYDNSAVELLAGDGGTPTDVLPIANTAGGTIVTAASPFFGEGDIQVVEMLAPAEGSSAPTVLAVKVAGTDFPSFILNSDMANTGLCLGDGLLDPSNEVQITVSGTGITIWSANQVKLRSDDIQLVGLTGSSTAGIQALVIHDMKFDAGVGPVVTDDTNGHTYRLGTSNGALTVTQVT